MEANANENESNQKPPSSPVNLKFNFIDFEPEGEQEDEKKKTNARRPRKTRNKSLEKPKNDKEIEIDIESYHAKQLQLELVRASYILIIYLTEKQPGFGQNEIEKFITYITSWPAKHARDEDIRNEESKFEGLQLGSIVNTIANLKVIVKNTA